MEKIYECNGKCMGERTVTFNSTVQVPISGRNVVALALQVAFICSGGMYSNYHKALGMGMGMKTISSKRFYEVIQLIYPVVNDMLEEITTAAKDQMKALSDHQIGSWKRAHL